MRFLLHASALVIALAARLDGQRPFATSRDSVSDAAAKLLNAGRGNESRILLQRSARGAASREQRALYRLEVGDSYLFDGQYAQALQTYVAVAASEDAKGVDSLISWAHRGMGLAEAFSGRNAQAAAHLAQSLGGASNPTVALGDSIEMYVITGQYDNANAALNRLEAAGGIPQYVHAFRALNLMSSGHCTLALEALAKAPDQNRPVPRAVRGRCAAKHGQTAQALALRDSVLKMPVPDPFASTMIIARDAARRIR